MTGILCDRRAPVTIGMVVMNIARPAMTDGLESAAMTKRTIVVVEMRILKVFIRSDKEGQNKKRAHQRDKILGQKVGLPWLKWYCHVKRRDMGYVGRHVLPIHVSGKRRRVRPMRKYLDVMKEDMQEEGKVFEIRLWRSCCDDHREEEPPKLSLTCR